MHTKYLVAALLLVLRASANAATPLPPEVAGVWGTAGSQFHGDDLWKGQAIYLDSDGVGGFVGGDGSDVLGVRLVVTSYDAKSQVIAFDLTEDGKVIDHGTLRYDKPEHTLVSPKDSQRYYRHAEHVSAEIRKAIGLEPHP